jgi:hypothetical protein
MKKRIAWCRPALVSVILGSQTFLARARFSLCQITLVIPTQPLSQAFSKVISIVTLYCKRTRALTYQNFFSPQLTAPQKLGSTRKAQFAHMRRVPNNTQDEKTPKCTLLNPY